MLAWFVEWQTGRSIVFGVRGGSLFLATDQAGEGPICSERAGFKDLLQCCCQMAWLLMTGVTRCDVFVAHAPLGVTNGDARASLLLVLREVERSFCSKHLPATATLIRPIRPWDFARETHFWTRFASTRPTRRRRFLQSWASLGA